MTASYGLDLCSGVLLAEKGNNSGANRLLSAVGYTEGEILLSQHIPIQASLPGIEGGRLKAMISPRNSTTPGGLE